MPLPPFPCYTVIFVSQRTPGDKGYRDEADEVEALARAQPGFLGVESVRNAEGKGITVTFYESAEAIDAWRRHPRHREAKDKGRREWFEGYEIFFGRVESGHAWTRPPNEPG